MNGNVLEEQIKKSRKLFVLSSKIKHKNWEKDDDTKLINLVQSYSDSKVKWYEISTHFKKTTIQCYTRYKQIDPMLKKGKWHKEEDERIKSLVEKHGKKWAFISKIIKNRSGKQIRDRYINFIDERNIRNGFTDEEDRKIMSLFKIHGPMWSIIARDFVGRTGDAIKKRSYSLIKPFMRNNYEITACSAKSDSYKNETHDEGENKKISKLNKIFAIYKVFPKKKDICTEIENTSSLCDIKRDIDLSYTDIHDKYKVNEKKCSSSSCSSCNS